LTVHTKARKRMQSLERGGGTSRWKGGSEKLQHDSRIFRGKFFPEQEIAAKKKTSIVYQGGEDAVRSLNTPGRTKRKEK